MKKLVINLTHRTDRKELFEKNNKSLKDYKFIEATYGETISYLDVLDMGYDVHKSWRSVPAAGIQRMKKGELGCSISHLNCWKEVLNSNETMIILEDDVIINWDLWDEKYYKEVIKREDCDFLYLQHNDAQLHMGHEGIVPHPTDDKLVSPDYPYNMTGYVLTPKGAKILIDSFEKELVVVDEYLPYMHRKKNLNIWALKEDSCNQIPRSENPSSIEINTYDLERFKDYSKVHFCTIGTDSDKTKNLFKSAEKYGVPLKNIGEDYDWEDSMESFGGGPKIKIMHDFVHSAEVDDMDIVFFTDGYDTFFVDDGDTIVDRFLEFNYDIVWAGETHLWPCEDDEDLSRAFGEKYNEFRLIEKNAGPDKIASPYLFLNSGGYIGRAWIIKELFSQYKNAKDFCKAKDHNSFVDDQEFCQRLFARPQKRIYDQTIDYDCYIFQTNESAMSKLENGQMWNPITNTCGCVYHGNNLSSNWATYDKLFNEHVDSSYNNLTPSLFRINQYGRFDVLEKDMIIVDFMDQAQCSALVDLAEMKGNWQGLKDDKFPAQEIRLKQLGLWDTLCKTWEESIYPIVEKYWHPMEMYGMRDAFVMKYSMDTQRKLNLHNDASLVTGSVKLNDNFEGGDLLFPRQGISNKDIPPGKMILFPGMVTHGHECTELTKGVKYSLTMWSSRYPGDIL